MRQRHFDTALALIFAVVVALLACKFADDRLGLCVEPDRPVSVNAGVQSN